MTTERKLGRIPSRKDPRTLRVESFLIHDELEPPEAARWATDVTQWNVQGNDQYGNCVIVTAAHAIQSWRAAATRRLEPLTNDEVINLSRTMGALDGYMILDRLKWWRNKTMWANRLWAYLEFSAADLRRHKLSIFAAGLSDIGLAMPAGWQTQEVWGTGTGRNWRPGSWGYHSVPVIGYDPQYFYLVTWGKLQRMTHAALAEYCDEAWLLINPEWLANAGEAPNNLDLAAIHAATIAAGR